MSNDGSAVMVKRCAGSAAALAGALATWAMAATWTMANASTLKLNEFTGYWSGMGTVTMVNGATEQLRCVATYKSPAPADLHQNLRCASTGYSISASVELKLTGASVKGTWEEKTYAANGLITGQVKDNGLALSIKGPNFAADMSLAHSACTQAIDILPTGVDVAKISIGLGKC